MDLDRIRVIVGNISTKGRLTHWKSTRYGKLYPMQSRGGGYPLVIGGGHDLSGLAGLAKGRTQKRFAD